MKLAIGTVVDYKKNYIGEIGQATICGFDLHKTKYQVMKHSLYDGAPMPSVKIWLFENEVTETKITSCN